MEQLKAKVEKIIDNIEKVFLGKREVVNLLMISCIAQGHILIEDVPGVGKTSLANAISQSFDASFKRIQFTPDTTPSDVVGFSMYNTKTNEFNYVKGAILNNIVLADELNRTSPKTQAALLEAMQDGQVTVDGKTHKIPKPFMLIATQNPSEQFGTYPLPESQLDRFMMVTSIGYPSEEIATQIVSGASFEKAVEQISTTKDLSEIQKACQDIHMCEELSKYIVQIAVATRYHRFIKTGVSTRGTILLARASKASALINGRDYVIPDDIKRLVMPVFAHRIILNRDGLTQHATKIKVLSEILYDIPIPEVSQ